jgi:hypothetical protein
MWSHEKSITTLSIRHLALVVSVLSGLTALPVKAQVNQVSREAEVAEDSRETDREVSPEIRHLGEFEQLATTVTEWVVQIVQSRVQVTAVQVNPTEEGLEVVLATSTGELPQTLRTTYGNTLAIDLSRVGLKNSIM